MALISKAEIIEALERLGQLAEERRVRIELVLVGGAAMVLAFDARASTRDVDAITIAPSDSALVREIAQIVASEREWESDWLNDAVKGFVPRISKGPVLLDLPWIKVMRASTEQLLAMKLSAWRDDVDIADARSLLQEVESARSQEDVWKSLEPYLARGQELKAHYAFLDLWEETDGNSGTDGESGC